MNKFEEDLKATLDEWALKGHGIALSQINAAFFLQVLRSKGYEIVPMSDIQKVRHEHHIITGQVLEAHRQLSAAKQRIELLQTQREVLKEEPKPKSKPKEKPEEKVEEKTEENSAGQV